MRLAVALLLMIIASSITPHVFDAQKPDIWVMYPKIGAPEWVKVSGTLKVRVKAPQGAVVRQVELRGIYGEYRLSGVKQSWSNGVLSVEAGIGGVAPALYSLVLTVDLGGTEFRLTENNSVYVYEKAPSIVKIIHVGDVYYDVKPTNLARLISQVNFLSPDLVVITGKLLRDSGLDGLEMVRRELARLRFPVVVTPYPNAGPYFERLLAPRHFMAFTGFGYVVSFDTSKGYIDGEEVGWLNGTVFPLKRTKMLKVMVTYSSTFAKTENHSWVDPSSKIIGALAPKWRSHMDETWRFLNVTRNCDFRLIFSGSLGRDEVYSYFMRHHFVATTSLVGGFEGYRLLRVRALPYADVISFTSLGTPPSIKPHSIGISRLSVKYGPRNDGSRDAVTAVVMNRWGVKLHGFLVFLVSKNYSMWAYTLYSPATVPFTVNVTRCCYVWTVEVVANPGKELRVTVAREKDGEPPRVGNLTYRVVDGKLRFTVNVTDSGWGVEAVNLTLVHGTMNITVEMNRSSGDVYTAELNPVYGNITVYVTARDYALNTVRTSPKQISIKPTSPTTSTSTASTSPHTSTSTTTTTTTTTTSASSTSSPKPTSPPPTSTSSTSTTTHGGGNTYLVASLAVLASVAILVVAYWANKRRGV